MWEAVRKKLFGQDAAPTEQPASEQGDQGTTQPGQDAPTPDRERGTLPVTEPPTDAEATLPDQGAVEVSPPGHAPQGLAAEAAPLSREAEAGSAATEAAGAWTEAAAALPETAPRVQETPPDVAPASGASQLSGAAPELDLAAATQHAQEVAAEAAAQAQELADATAAHAEEMTADAAAHARDITADAAAQAAMAPQAASLPETMTTEGTTAPATPSPQAATAPQPSSVAPGDAVVARQETLGEATSPLAPEAALPAQAEPARVQADEAEPAPPAEMTAPAPINGTETATPASASIAEPVTAAGVVAEAAEAGTETKAPDVEAAQEATPISGEEVAPVTEEETAPAASEEAASVTEEETAVAGEEAAPGAQEETQAIPALTPLAAGAVAAGRYTITQVNEAAEPSEGAVAAYQAMDSRSYEECWSCGSTSNGAGTRFCQNCGAPIQNHPVVLVQTREATGLPHEVEQDGAFFHVQPERRLFGAEGIGIEIGAHSAEGPHHPNEDSYWYTTQTLCANTRRQSSAVVVFADGMGGYAPGSGLISSRIAAVVGSHIATALATRSDDAALESDEAESMVRDGIAAANKMVLEEIARTGEMGATLVVAMIYGDTGYLANVGDSRAYYVDSHGTITQITRDQSLVAQEVEQGHLGEDDIYTAAGNNIILHAVGEPEVEQAADWYTQPLEPGSYLVLCSDGYWKTMRGLVIPEGLFSHNDTLGDAARALVDDALAHNSDDNTTVVLVGIS